MPLVPLSEQYNTQRTPTTNARKNLRSSRGCVGRNDGYDVWNAVIVALFVAVLNGTSPGQRTRQSCATASVFGVVRRVRVLLGLTTRDCVIHTTITVMVVRPVVSVLYHKPNFDLPALGEAVLVSGFWAASCACRFFSRLAFFFSCLRCTEPIGYAGLPFTLCTQRHRQVK